MDSALPEYDARYLAGVLLFNRGDYFEAHEVWEALWMDTPAPEKKFYQGLIQAAVGLCHFANGNLRGAVKLYASSRGYMASFGSPYLGMDTAAFWAQMERCFAALLADPNADRHTLHLDESQVPEIALDPQPESWPDPEEFVEAEED
jgi:uncharacterized protein